MTISRIATNYLKHISIFTCIFTCNRYIEIYKVYCKTGCYCKTGWEVETHFAIIINAFCNKNRQSPKSVQGIKKTKVISYKVIDDHINNSYELIKTYISICLCYD